MQSAGTAVATSDTRISSIEMERFSHPPLPQHPDDKPSRPGRVKDKSLFEEK